MKMGECSLKLKDIINPAHIEKEQSYILPKEIILSEIDPAAIPDDVKWVCAVDEKGECAGCILAERLKNILQRQAEISLDFLLNEIDDGIIVVDSKGMIFYINAAYSRILGVPAGKILGKDLNKVENTAGLLEVLKTGKQIVRERQLIKTMGRYVSVRMSPIIKEGKVIGGVSIFHDMTEEDRLNQELQRVSQMAEEYSHRMEMQNLLKANNIIGESPKYLKSVYKATAVASTDATVLIRGENGVGKEVFTKLLYQHSNRKNKPYIVMNCAAVPENLIESELFGYEDGAFTGAKKGGKLGKIQLAAGGTLFLDEIGDMPLPMQVKLLRVLQEKEIEKIGGQGTVKVDFRLIAATNRPLERLIEEGKFRQDLFYRLNVVSIEIPPLRERGHDIVLLAAHFLQMYNEKYHKNLKFTEEVYQVFQRYNWPGNVRELQNVVESCVVLGNHNILTVYDLPDCFNSNINSKKAGNLAVHQPEWPERLEDAVAMCEKEVILNTLKKCQYSRKKAIEILGISRRTFYRKVEQLNIELEAEE